jgi:L-threonylcarbamoyladenylate synthase
MQTIHHDDEDAVASTAAALAAGAVVVVPTDTVYGLAALPDLADAVHAVYRAKGRPAGLHLPVLAASIAQVRALGVELNGAAAALASAWWPGPLTLACGFSPDSPRPAWLTGRDEVALRIPDHAFLLALMERTGVLLVTSANRHGAETPAAAEEAGRALSPFVSLVVDGGPLAASPSTLVNVRSAEAVVERQGAISRQAIAEALAATGERA